MTIIEIEELWKSFRVRQKVVEAVRGVSLSIQEGEMFGFLGPNGAGKTTTLRILTTLLAPSKGRATIAGYDLISEPDRVRACVGYVSQKGGADGMMTGRENMVIQARLYGIATKEARSSAAKLIENLDMAAFADRLVRTYSGGQHRRLDLALGLVHEPRVLFLDEPSIGLDPQSRAMLWAEVRKLHANGTTIFLTTHYLEEADQLCDRLAIIDDGRIVTEGTPSQLKRQVAGDVITLGLAQDREVFKHAQQLLKAHVFVREIQEIPASQEQEQKLQIYVERGEEALVTMLHLLDREGFHVHSVTLTRPSLDDVFLRLTGYSLEEAASKKNMKEYSRT